MSTTLEVRGEGRRVHLTITPPPEHGDPITVTLPADDLFDLLIVSSPAFTESVGMKMRQLIATTLTRDSELGIPTH